MANKHPNLKSSCIQRTLKNIDIKIYGVEKQIEYDFVVKPGGEVSDMRFEYKDIKKMEIDKEGHLVLKTKFAEFRHAKPIGRQIFIIHCST